MPDDESADTPERPAPEGGSRSARWLPDLEVLFETVRDLASTLSTNEVIERLIDRTLVHLDSELASVLLMEADGSLRITHARGLPEEVVAQTRMKAGEGIAGHVVATGEPLLIPDVERDPRFRRRNHERYYTSSCVCAPLVFQGKVRGVINVNNKRTQEEFDASDLRLLEAIAAHAAVALANARRFEEMEVRAQRDALTNLANHGFFWSTLESEVKRAQRHERELALVMADVDHFKAYNDRLGHRQGDSALVSVARLIAGCTRSHDLPARYGGEEFAVVLPETPMEGAIAFAEKVRQAVESLDECGLTVSVGVACLDQSDGTASDLVETADAQLYRAKSAGRNRVCAAR
jgi:diguanylate cyclase (GGDEF)-like protein